MSRHLQFTRFQTAVLVALIAALSPLAAVAHPITGRDLLKFEQQPMIATTVPNANGTPGVYYGHDELSTGYGFPNTANIIPFYQGKYMADDFADNISSSIVHVKWWGSYLNDVINPSMPVTKFLIAFESDVPAGPAPSFSHPGQVLSSQVVKLGPISPGSGTYTETLVRGPDPLLGESLYEYNAELNLGADFPELKDTVYWLKIAALVDVPQGLTFPATQPPTFATRWGWHNRDYTVQNTLASPAVFPGENAQGPINGVPIWHFQDDAVTGNFRFDPNAPSPINLIQPLGSMQPTRYIDGIDGPAGAIPGAIGIGGYSKDLAFAIYTVQIPEPASCLMSLVGFAAVLLVRRRSARD